MTLPSNTEDFSQNTTSQFRVRLPNPIELHGEWEIGLVEIQYPHSWDNIMQSHSENSIIISLPATKEILTGLHLKYFMPPGTYDTIQGLVDTINETFLLWNFPTKWVKFHNRLTISDEKIEEELSRWGSKMEKSGPFVTLGYSEHIRRIRLRISQKIVGVTFSPTLQYVLGLGGARLMIRIPPPLYTGKYPPDLTAGFNTLYTYCNLIDPQIVGNSLVPLLRAITIEGNHGDSINKIFLSPHYLKLRTKTFDTVEIAIKTDTDEPVRFNFGKVILKLHLRKVSLRNTL